MVTGANLTVEIYTDNYPGETSWEILNSSDQVSVSFDAENIDYTINLIDITGRTIITRNYSSLNGKQNIELPLENIETGNYMLTLRSENGVVNKQISVE